MKFCVNAKRAEEFCKFHPSDKHLAYGSAAEPLPNNNNRAKSKVILFIYQQATLAKFLRLASSTTSKRERNEEKIKQNETHLLALF